jgi:PspA-Associated protein
MIVRILGQGQYKIDDFLIDKLNAIDNHIVDHVTKGDRDGFRKDLARLISIVKEQGEPLDPVDIIQSDIIVPPMDLTFEEAEKIFSGYGLIKD